MVRYFLVGIGGFLGAIARFWIGDLVAARLGSRFPFGTLLVNCSGCFALGLVIAVLDGRTHWNSGWRYLVPIGFIGAYTTFSTFEMETFGSLQEGRFGVAALNIIASLAVGLVAVWLGMTAGNMLAAPQGAATSAGALVGSVAASLESAADASSAD